MSKKWESEQKTEFLLLHKLHIPLTPLIRTTQGVLKNVCAAPSPRVLIPLVWGVSKASSFPKAPWVSLRYVQGSKATAQKKKKVKREKSQLLAFLVSSLMCNTKYSGGVEIRNGGSCLKLCGDIQRDSQHMYMPGALFISG